MKHSLAFSVLVLGAFAFPNAPKVIQPLYLDGRIINGKPAEVGQIPWQVAEHFTRSTGTHFCGGSLISDQWVLTAAHCADGAQNFTLRLGGLTLNETEEGRVDIETSTFVVHPDYNALVHNDVALVHLPEPVEFTDRIQPVLLPKSGNVVTEGKRVQVSGWGKTSDESSSVSPVLNVVELNTITNKECQGIYGNGIVIDSTICCRGEPDHSTCNGDSGGPLVEIDESGVATHIGIVSWVHIDGCASSNPSGYVRTESMLSWIKEITGLL